MTIAGVHVEITSEAVVVRATAPLTVMSSAVVGGGLGRTLAIVNVHVPKNFRGEHAERVLADFIARRHIVGPWVGLLTGAWTEKAEIATEKIAAIPAMAVVT